MDIGYQLGVYLQNANYGTIGTDIFIGQIPEDNNGIYIVRSGGQLDKYVPIEETVLDIYVKDSSSADAITLLENIKRYIHRMHSTQTTGAYIYSFLVIGDIEDVARDLDYQKIYKLTLQVMHRDLQVIS